MGRDKATLEIDGRPMAVRVADALVEAGAAEVFCVGGASGDPALRVVPDDRAAEGPLTGLITALQAASQDLVVVVPCDLLEPSADAIRRLVNAASGASATVPVVAGRPQWLHGAWRREACLGPLTTAFDRGERSIHRAIAALEVRFVDDAGPGFDDADTPEDLVDGG
jgi:molybdopterin-guanine dinucleotide biosynthesis protein A